MTGYIVRKTPDGCVLIYMTQSDPRGICACTPVYYFAFCSSHLAPITSILFYFPGITFDIVFIYLLLALYFCALCRVCF